MGWRLAQPCILHAEHDPHTRRETHARVRAARKKAQSGAMERDALRTSDATQGNAFGIGLAEFCTTRAAEAIDPKKTWVNCITANHVSATMVPIHYPTDREVLDAALSTIGLTEPADARLLWIKNTAEMELLACSTAYLDEIKERDDLELLDAPQDLPLDESGNLPRFVSDD